MYAYVFKSFLKLKIDVALKLSSALNLRVTANKNSNTKSNLQTGFSAAFDTVALGTTVAIDCYNERVISDWTKTSDGINVGR